MKLLIPVSVLKRRARQKKYDRAHKKEKAARSKKWRKKNPGNATAWRRRNPERAKAIGRKYVLKKYNITSEEYEILLKAQKGKCAFRGCKATTYKANRKDALAVDHDHLTDEIRGLLCYRHNILIGLAKDSILELEAAIEYLLRSRS